MSDTERYSKVERHIPQKQSPLCKFQETDNIVEHKGVGTRNRSFHDDENSNDMASNGITNIIIYWVEF